MFALPASVCYSEVMRQLSILLGLFAVVGASVYLFTDQLLLFIMTGLVPFTSIVISPFGMILFWIFIFPSILLCWKTAKSVFWKLIETIARLHQKRINRRTRTFAPHLSPSQTCLIAYSFLIIHSEDSTKENVSSELRSRFAPLPS